MYLKVIKDNTYLIFCLQNQLLLLNNLFIYLFIRERNRGGECPGGREGREGEREFWHGAWGGVQSHDPEFMTEAEIKSQDT